MVRFTATQSVWKNSEDEILKAAVMKYGLNQWGRVASLFAKRSARQCKARWDEWLDPSIKKTEWSREEDEKLLHLAKLMPTQWRTIAPLVGRTAAQCLERYERLLDAVSRGQDGEEEEEEEEEEVRAEGEEEGAEEGAGSSSAGVSSLKKKRVAAAETLPAKPDAIDMDEEELEMLSEAKARLANTLGKKAKRKARERQLEEQQRVAQLQKRRELKAAGISTGKLAVVTNKKRRRKNSDAEQIDYTTEVPFEQLAPKGPYDVSQERLESARRERDERARIEKLARAQDAKQEQERKKQQKKKKTTLSVRDLEAKLAAERRRNEEALAIARSARPALSLPSPHISDAELEDVAKASMGLPGSSSSSAALFAAPPMPTRRRDDVIAQEARNQLARDKAAMGSSSSFVAQGEGTGFQGALPTTATSEPRRGLASLASRRTFAGANGRVVVLRDDLGINRPFGSSADGEDALEDAEQLAQGAAAGLKNSLTSLPAPEYEYSVQVKKGKQHDDDDMDLDETRAAIGEDARARDRKKQRLILERNQKLMEMRPTAMKLGLPEIPPLEDISSVIEKEKELARRLILEELERGLVEGDSYSLPVSACKELEEVMAASVELDSFPVGELFDQQQSSSIIWTLFSPKELFALAKNAAIKVSKESDELKKVAEAAIQSESEKAERSAVRLMELFKQARKALTERELYKWMKQLEDDAMSERFEKLTQEVNTLKSQESELQRIWAEKVL